MTNGTFSQVIDAAVRALYDQSMVDISSVSYWRELGLNQYSPDVPAEQLSGLSAPGVATLTIEGQQFGSNNLYKGYPVTLSLRKYTSELSYTKEDLHWLQKANESKRVMEIKSIVNGGLQPLVHQMNLDASRFLYLGHGTTFFTGGNSEALFASHTIRQSGGTQSNKFNSGETEEALSASSLSKAISRMNRLQSHNGIQMLPVRNLKLIVSVEGHAEALRIVNSEYGPNNANLGLSEAGPTITAGRGLKIQVVVDPNVPTGREKQWALIDETRAANQLFMAVAWGPELASETQVRKGTYSIDADAYFGPVANGWQFGFGSIGNGATI